MERWSDGATECQGQIAGVVYRPAATHGWVWHVHSPGEIGVAVLVTGGISQYRNGVGTFLWLCAYEGLRLVLYAVKGAKWHSVRRNGAAKFLGRRKIS